MHKVHASEGSTHWYTPEGDPAYTVIGANGKERNTTLRDARKMNLVPSVTTVMGIAAKPGLERWKIDQALMAVLTLPMEDGESLDDFKKRALADSKEHAIQAAERGTAIHAALQGYFEGGPFGDEYLPFINAADKALFDEFSRRDWVAEEAFCSPLGYGGKVDLYCRGTDVPYDRPIVVDFKTKEFGPEDKVKAFDEQIMQLDAYRHGLGLPHAILANLYISVSHPGLAQLVIHPEGNHFERFKHLLSFWQLTKNYVPELEQAA